MITALRALWIAIGRSWGSLRGAQQGGGGMGLTFLLPFGRGIYACQPLGRLPGGGQRGPVRGCALPRPPLHPPGAPPKKANNFHKLARARDSSCGSFLPSLCSLRRSPSAPRKCQIPLSRWSESASAKHQQQIKSLKIVHCPILLTPPPKNAWLAFIAFAAFQ